MEIKCLPVGQLQANCYLLWDQNTRDCFIIDPGDEADFLTDEILRLQLKPQAILLTHGHYDHCLACLELKLNFNIPIYLDPKDNFLYQNASSSARHWSGTKSFKQPATAPYPKHLQLGTTTIEIIPTPGHTPGSVSLYSKPFLFTGDTLFSDGVGATNHRYSSAKDLHHSLQTIKALPSGTEVYPGHGEFFLL